MPEIVFAIPVVPGQEALDRQTLDELSNGRREEYAQALRDAGITRQAVWHQQMPDGTLAVVYVEADDPEAARRFSASDATLNTWFREQMRTVHGVDISEPMAPVEKVHDVGLS